MFYPAEEMEYWFEVHGEGIPLVLLHGFTGSSAAWNHLIQSEIPGIQFITVDLPGHGRTKGNGLKSMDECCHDLSKLFRYLEIGKFIMAGYSMGGRTALTYAVKYPEMLHGLLLESASPGLESEEARNERIAKDEALALRIEGDGLKTFIDYWESIPLFETQKLLPDNKRMEIRKGRLSQSPEGLSRSLRGMGTGKQASNWEHLKKLNFPVQLIAGELDKKFVMINEKMRNELPQAELSIVQGAGHAIHVEKPDTYGKIVAGFVNSLKV